jgi:hypothetical protein
MGTEDHQEGLHVARCRGTDGRREHRVVLASDAEAELLDEVVPVE